MGPFDREIAKMTLSLSNIGEKKLILIFLCDEIPHKTAKMLPSKVTRIYIDYNAGSERSELSEPVNDEMVLTGEPEQLSLEDFVQVNKVDAIGGENVHQCVAPVDNDLSGEVNMEASISAGDVMRVGGFGARDDITSFLPVASDSTDFEAYLRDARDYEEPQVEIGRPGLGWKEIRE